MGATLAIRPHAAFGPLAKAGGAIALVLLTAVVTYLFTARLNVETAIQQQQSASIVQFEQSGAQMDVSLSQFVDAILDRKGVTAARANVRTAISLHAAQANSLKPLTGEGNIEQYLKGLGDLREYADTADGRLTAKQMAQQHVNIMAYREKLTALARSRVYQ